MKCKHCGSQIPQGNKFCEECGKPVDKDKFSNTKYIIIGFVVVLIVVSIFMLASLFKKPNINTNKVETNLKKVSMINETVNKTFSTVTMINETDPNLKTTPVVNESVSTFDIKVIPIKDKITLDEVAEFEIDIRNSLNTEERFTIKKAGYPFWDMYTKPLQNPITLKVPSQSSASIKLFVDPLYITSVDTYTLDLGVVLSSTEEEKKVPIIVGIIASQKTPPQSFLDSINLGFFKASSIQKYNKPFDGSKDSFEFKMTLDDISDELVLPIRLTNIRILYTSEYTAELLITKKDLDSVLNGIGEQVTINVPWILNYKTHEVEESGSIRYSIDYSYTKQVANGTTEMVRATFTSPSKPIYLVKSG